MVIDGFVVCCVLILIRWQCSICRKTFTHYPEQVVPYKRYALDVILRLSQEYTGQDESSYRSVVRSEGQRLAIKKAKTARSMNVSSVTPRSGGGLVGLGKS